MSAPSIVVTGSASGLGAATALAFAEAGRTVHGFDRAGAHPAEPAHPGIRPHDVDVTDDAGVRAAFDAAAAGGPVAAVVHCAGIAAFGPTNPGNLVSAETGETLDNLETIERTLRVNLLGSLVVARHAARTMAARGRAPQEENGVLILTSSGAALEGKTGQSAYSASKAGVIGMTLPLAREFSPLGIRVVTIAPGLFETPIIADTPRLERHVPFPQRVGRPEEFASLARHIVENPYLNGEVIRIDGGTRGDFRSAAPFVR